MSEAGAGWEIWGDATEDPGRAASQVRTRLSTFSPCTSAADRYHSISHLGRQVKVSQWAQSQSWGEGRGRRVPPFSPRKTFVCVFCQGKHNVASLYTAGGLINAFPFPRRRLFQAGVQRIRKTLWRGCSILSTSCCAPNTVAVGELCISVSHAVL